MLLTLQHVVLLKARDALLKMWIQSGTPAPDYF